MALPRKRPLTQAPTPPPPPPPSLNHCSSGAAESPTMSGAPGSPGPRYSHARLQAGQGARGTRGKQQHQGQGHRAPRRPRLRKDRHRAQRPAPRPPSGPQLTGRPGGPREPPPPRAPWPGDAQGAAAGAQGPASRPARARSARLCAHGPVAGGRPALAPPPARTPAQTPPTTPSRPRPRPRPSAGPRPELRALLQGCKFWMPCGRVAASGGPRARRPSFGAALSPPALLRLCGRPVRCPRVPAPLSCQAGAVGTPLWAPTSLVTDHPLSIFILILCRVFSPVA